MPDISEMTTIELLEAAKKLMEESNPAIPTDEIDELLEERVVPSNYPDESLRGGIRPTRPSL